MKMDVKRLICGTAICLALSISGSTSVSADVYRYIDKNGVWHFTNIKSDHRYRLYVRTMRKTPTQYKHDYGDIIREASLRFGVDADFVKAIIKAESGFNHRAISVKGAQGLMQLMPETADAMAVNDPFDPEENIFGGTKYFSNLLKRFNNDNTLALAAYNAGPERVESCNGMPPFPETKAFVKRVMRYYHVYCTDIR